MLLRLLDVRELTQVDLAQRLGLPKERVSLWVNGWRVLDAYWLVRVGEVLDLTDAEVRTLTTAAANLAHLWAHVTGGAEKVTPPLTPRRASPDGSS